MTDGLTSVLLLFFPFQQLRGLGPESAQFLIAGWFLSVHCTARQYGSVDDERFKKAEADIQRRVRDLPPYRKGDRRRP